VSACTGGKREPITTIAYYDLESARRLDYGADFCQRIDVHWQATFGLE